MDRGPPLRPGGGAGLVGWGRSSLPERTGGAPEDILAQPSKSKQQWRELAPGERANLADSPGGDWRGLDNGTRWKQSSSGGTRPPGLLTGSQVAFAEGNRLGGSAFLLQTPFKRPEGLGRGSGEAVHQRRWVRGRGQPSPQFGGAPQQGRSQAASLPDGRARGVDPAPRGAVYLPAAPLFGARPPPPPPTGAGPRRGGAGGAFKSWRRGAPTEQRARDCVPRAGRAVRAGGTRRPDRAGERNRNSCEARGLGPRSVGGARAGALRGRSGLSSGLGLGCSPRAG